MTTVNATCPRCGPVTVGVADVGIVDHAAHDDGPAVFRLFCPCGAVTDVVASARNVSTLAAAGARWVPPGPLTDDEVDFIVLVLSTTDTPQAELERRP